LHIDFATDCLCFRCNGLTLRRTPARNLARRI
jgi:hypothetical protein